MLSSEATCRLISFPGRGVEYIPTELLIPMEDAWQDVTADVSVATRGSGKCGPYVECGEFVVHNGYDLAKLICGGKYRLRKVNFSTMLSPAWAFLIERKVVE